MRKMRSAAVVCVVVAVFVTGCSRGPDSFAGVADIAAALEEEGIDCPSVEPSSSGELVAEQGTCDGNDIYLFDNERDLDRWLSVGGGLGDVVVGADWAVVPGGAAQDIADALGGEVR